MLGCWCAQWVDAKPTNRTQQQAPVLATLGPEQLTQLRQQMQEIARDEVTARVGGVETRVLNEAAQSERRSDDLTFYVTLAAAGWGVVATLVLGVGALSTFLGSRAVGRIREAEIDVVEPVKNRMQQLNHNISEALANAMRFMSNVTSLESPTMVGSRPEAPPVGEMQQMEEADIVILIADKIGANTQQNDLVAAFVRLGRYWNYLENHTRAIARFQRALAMDRNSWEAYQGMARAFYGMATMPGTAAWVRVRQLDQAEDYCRKAQLAAGQPRARILFDFGFIEDARSNLNSAINWYRAAKSANPGDELAIIKYNLASCYARTAALENALEELRDIVGVDENWECIPGDPDFAPMLQDAIFGLRLRSLIEAERYVQTLAPNH